MLWHLGNTDVVASVYYESVKLVRHSYRHSEVESVSGRTHQNAFASKSFDR